MGSNWGSGRGGGSCEKGWMEEDGREAPVRRECCAGGEVDTAEYMIIATIHEMKRLHALAELANLTMTLDFDLAIFLASFASSICRGYWGES